MNPHELCKEIFFFFFFLFLSLIKPTYKTAVNGDKAVPCRTLLLEIVLKESNLFFYNPHTPGPSHRSLCRMFIVGSPVC